MLIWEVVNFLGPERAANLVPEPVKIVFGCLFCFDNNFRTLQDVAETLEGERASLQGRVNVEVSSAQDVDPKVETWLEETEKNRRKMTEIGSHENVGLFSTSRFSFTKKVKETTEAMNKLLESCNFDIIARPPRPIAVVSTPLAPTLEFESRKDIEEGVMASLRDSETYRVGICGMGGVGKTTMARRVMSKARDNLFKEIVMVVVGQKACQKEFKKEELVRIQNEVATSLGWRSGEGSLSSKDYLLHRLTKITSRCLIFLDDVWEDLNLDDLGIPCSSTCKVLLTSRNRDVFKDFKFHAVEILFEDEAWNLFKLKAGSCIDHPDVAQQVVKECEGLPIALVSVGAELENTKDECDWNALLDQLKSSNPRNLRPVLRDVYEQLRSSYDFLGDELLKSLFLLSCLFPKDYNIPLDEMTFYAMGLGMLKEIEIIEKARNEVCSLVGRLIRSRYLLLEGGSKNDVRIHGFIRNAAIFIPFDEKLITHDSKRNDCTWISPYIGEKIKLDGGPTVFPNLQLLWIDCESRDKELDIDDHFFQEMKNLNVLSIKWSPLQQLPETTILLVKLQTLVLDHCESLKSISVVGKLLDLKILICRWCSSISSLEIGGLNRLRLLELSNCKKLRKIGAGIISNMRRLEELTLVGGFNDWEVENTKKELENASLSELQHLPNLSRLKI